MIAGGAGTGKTLIAKEKAIRLAAEGMQTLLVCFNRGLADNLREQCEGIENLTVASFHQLCHRWNAQAQNQFGRDLIAEVERQHPGADLFNQIMPIALANAIDLFGPKYDVIVVDEAQDFGDEYWMPIEMLLNDLEQSLLYVFLDENQDIYHRSGSIPIPGEPMMLDRNCRNTSAIHAAAYRHYRGAVVEPPEISGARVECLNAGDLAGQATVIGRLVTKLVAEEHISPHQIAILLCDGSLREQCERLLKEAPIPKTARLGRLEDYRPGVVVVDTVARFKGLERAVIILWAFDDSNPASDRETLYVGMSRAKSILYLSGSRGACERLVCFDDRGG
jgi:superfamily I DNA/RNA helicase